MKKGPLLMLLMSLLFKGLRSHPVGQMEVAKLKAYLVYVRAIKTIRFLFLGFLSTCLSLVFLAACVIVFHISLFVYTPWSPQTKMVVGFVLSAVYLLAALALFAYTFASDQWLKMFHADTILERLRNAAKDPDQPSNGDHHERPSSGFSHKA